MRPGRGEGRGGGQKGSNILEIFSKHQKQTKRQMSRLFLCLISCAPCSGKQCLTSSHLMASHRNAHYVYRHGMQMIKAAKEVYALYKTGGLDAARLTEIASFALS